MPLTLFGDGPDLAGIKREAAAAGLDWRFEACARKFLKIERLI